MNFDEIICSYIKPTFYAMWLGLLAVITSTLPALIALFVIWIVNFFMGLGADVDQGKSFSIDKAFNSIKQLILIGCLMLLVYGIPFMMKDIAISERGVKYLTYVAVYFYLTNITKNGKQMWPKWRLIVFLHELLSTQIFFTLKSYLGFKK